MSYSRDDSTLPWLIAIAVIFFSVAGLCRWYQAGVQQKVYARQGVIMSRWEVFIGAKPVERALVPAQKN